MLQCKRVGAWQNEDGAREGQLAVDLVCKYGLRVSFGNGMATFQRTMKPGIVTESIMQVKFGMAITPHPWERQSQREPITSA